MIKWPGRIEPGLSNEMFAIHDFLPTFASILEVDLPTDRPFDGVDQSNFRNVPGTLLRYNYQPPIP